MLRCVEAGLGAAEGQTFRILAENGVSWEICLGGEYRKVNKRSGLVTGWKKGPVFSFMPKAASSCCVENVIKFC